MGLLDDFVPQIISEVVALFVDTPGTLTKHIVATYGLTTGNESGVTDPTYSIKHTPPYPYKYYQINGTSILSTDVYVYLPAFDLPISLAPENEVTYSFTIGSVVHKVISIEPVSVGDTIGMWKLQLRA